MWFAATASGCRRPHPEARPEAIPLGHVQFVAGRTLPGERHDTRAGCEQNCPPAACHQLAEQWICIRRCRSDLDCPAGLYCYCPGGPQECGNGLRGGIFNVCLAGPKTYRTPADGGGREGHDAAPGSWKPGDRILDKLRTP